MGGNRLPVTDGAARALAAFQARVDAGRVPKRRRYARVVGGVVGSHRHQWNKRKRQRQACGLWRYRGDET